MSEIKKISFYTLALIFPMDCLRTGTMICCQWSWLSDYAGKYLHAIFPQYPQVISSFKSRCTASDGDGKNELVGPEE